MRGTSIYFPLMLGFVLIGVPGCSKKAVQSGGDTQSSQQGVAKGSDALNASASDGTRNGPGTNFPDTSLSGREASSGLRGLDKIPPKNGSEAEAL